VSPADPGFASDRPKDGADSKAGQSPAPAQGGTGSPRAEAQRARILYAAQQCFVDRGFHAASVANIAEASAMSPGLIYRYFRSKNEIILAIIERQLEERRADIAELSSSTDIVEGAAQLFIQWRDRDPSTNDAALFLEMTAEASRDPQIAEALRRADKTARSDFRDWLSRSAEEGGLGLPPDLAEVRSLVLQCFIEGLAIRALREPDLDPQVVRSAVEHFVPGLLSD
jgi:AcrR family transcriptional regulator